MESGDTGFTDETVGAATSAQVLALDASTGTTGIVVGTTGRSDHDVTEAVEVGSTGSGVSDHWEAVDVASTGSDASDHE